jgi:predicted HAD superfamily Cof-like phosphohydrolase
MTRKSWPQDVTELHEKFGHSAVVQQMTDEQLRAFLQFRLNFLAEELDEIRRAVVAGEADGVVDGIVDLCVVGVGTLDAFGVDAQKAWDVVHAANMAKQAGQNDSRPNQFGFPDLVKGPGWKKPDHGDNLGTIQQAIGAAR